MRAHLILSCLMLAACGGDKSEENSQAAGTGAAEASTQEAARDVEAAKTEAAEAMAATDAALDDLANEVDGNGVVVNAQ